MAVLLLRAYMGAPAGQVVELPATTEAALIAQNLAQASTPASIAAGNYTVNTMSGIAAIAAGANSVTITNSMVNANSNVIAYVSQATADTSLTQVVRVVPANGSVQIFGNANATAATLVDWVVIPSWPTQAL